MEQKEQKVSRDKRGRIHKGGMPKGHKTAKVLGKEAMREALREQVAKHMAEMAESQIAAAKGTKYLVYRNRAGGEFRTVTQEMVKEGILEKDNVVIEVWDKQPSTPAFTDLMNRALDKPAEQKSEIDVNMPGVEAVLMTLLAARKRVADARAGG